MTEQVFDITDLPKSSSTRKKTPKFVAVGILAAGTLLLIDDQVKKFSPKSRRAETPKN